MKNRKFGMDWCTFALVVSDFSLARTPFVLDLQQVVPAMHPFLLAMRHFV